MKSNMYRLSVKQLNLFVGCEHDCTYCVSSFQRQLKRWAKSKRGCELCAQWKPHTHFERMKLPVPRTRYMQFIFLCANGDVAFCPTPDLEKIIDWIKSFPDRTFLLQSKDPSTFNRVKHLFPENLILGTTIETQNYFITRKLSKAPDPFQRYVDLCNIVHPLKMVTIEPVLRFNPDIMIKWMEEIKPCMIWLGYDSKPKENKLPEPALADVKCLHWELSMRGFSVILKTIRKAWWEK